MTAVDANTMRLATLLAIAGLVPAGCSITRAAGVRPEEPAAAKSSQKQAQTEQDRPTSALAYEHYLTARLMQQAGRNREAIHQMRQALVYDHGNPYLHAQLGKLYAAEGLWRLAQEEAREGLAIEPDYVPALLLSARAAQRSGKRKRAVELCERIIALDPKRIEAYIRLAEILLDQGDKERALHVLTEMTDANPESAGGFKRLGDLYFERGEEKKAETYYRRVLQLDPSRTGTIETLASLLESQGRYQEAIQVFVEALETAPEYPQYMAYMARLYLKAGDRRSANAYFDQLRASSPNNARLIAHVYTELNMHAEAIRELNDVLEQDPNYHFERLLLAILYENRKEYQKAMAELAKIPVNSKLYTSAQIHMGYSLRHLKRWEEAERQLRKTLEIARDDGDITRIHRILGEVHAAQKRYREGLRLLDEAIAAHPDLTDLLEAKSNLLFEAGRATEAIATLKKALEEKPRDIALWYALGALHERMGKIPESLQAMREVLEIDPNNYSALNFIGYTLADQGRDLEEAERLIRRALLLDPGNGAIIDSLGWVLYRKGDYQEALEYLQRADRVSPGEAVIIMHVGDAYRKLGQRDEAIREYRRALDTDPTGRDRTELLERFRQMGIEP